MTDTDAYIAILEWAAREGSRLNALAQAQPPTPSGIEAAHECNGGVSALHRLTLEIRRMSGLDGQRYPCPECGATGRLTRGERCPSCDGRGHAEQRTADFDAAEAARKEPT